MAAQTASSRPNSEEAPVERRRTTEPVTPVLQLRNGHVPPRTNSPFSDPKFLQGRDLLGRKPSAVGSFPEDFYQSAGPSPVVSRSHTPQPGSRAQTPHPGSRSQTPHLGSRPGSPPPTPGAGTMQRFLNDAAREPKPLSEEIGLCEYEIQAQRLSMARLWAAKVLVEQAFDYADLDKSIPREEQPLCPFGNKLQEIMFLLTDVVTRLGNNKLVKDYEKAYTVPRNSKFHGKDFDKVIARDAAKMLTGVQAVADQIVREIQ
ncbi:uncharacterized protein LTR77_003321 [Saxophila tyrrhenica]|uniref:Uncharacterized protein n=1 Tax=Saxophila tyrrhenica TaxID=1690608 RepID=A0AAV9PHH5_9PEZI|nr:hypothetical protein LTR77_003321 [Saxophila tyrrhenica]